MAKWLIIAAIILAGISASPALAHREWRGGYGNEPGNFADIAGAPGLNLSVEQKERIDAIRETHRRDIQPLQEQFAGKARQLRELWLANAPDRERILALQRDVHDLRGRLLERITTYRLEVLRMLTPEQQTTVQAFEAERHRGRMGPGMHRGPFPPWREGGPPPTDTLRRERAPWPPPKGSAPGPPEQVRPAGPASR